MSLFDFAPEKVAERDARAAEDARIMDLLGRFTAEMLRDSLRNEGGRPKPEFGDGENWRHYYLDECQRRGVRLLEQLGWPSHDGALYVNLHTGDVLTLLDVATDEGYFPDDTIPEQVWHVIECWEPYDPAKPNRYKIRYLEEQIEAALKLKASGKKDAYHKNQIRRIPEHQKMVEQEKAKAAGGD